MMKSDISQVMCLALTTFFLLSCVFSLTEGKCQGNWAIHACWGGNGKRSDPSMDEGPNPSLLRQLLLRNGPVFTPPALEVNMEDLSPAEPDEELCKKNPTRCLDGSGSGRRCAHAQDDIFVKNCFLRGWMLR